MAEGTQSYIHPIHRLMAALAPATGFTAHLFLSASHCPSSMFAHFASSGKLNSNPSSNSAASWFSSAVEFAGPAGWKRVMGEELFSASNAIDMGLRVESPLKPLTFSMPKMAPDLDFSLLNTNCPQ